MKILALSLFLAYSVAQVIGPPGAVNVDNSGPNPVARSLSVNWYPQNNPRLFDLRGDRINTNHGNNSDPLDGVRFLLNTLNDASIYFEYYKNSSNLPTTGPNTPNPISDSAGATLSLVIKQYLLFEYLDLDGVPGYQFGGADNITGSYVLGHSAVQWKAPVVNSTVYIGVNGTNVTVQIIVWETVDEVYYIRWVIADYPITYNGIVLTPNIAKIDIGIRWFDNPKHFQTPYTTGPSAHNNTRVGLIAIIGGYVRGAPIDVFHRNNSVNGTFSVSANNFTGGFDYVRYANCSQKGSPAAGAADVKADVIETTNAPGNLSIEVLVFPGWTLKVVAFSFDGFDRPQEVFWDPTVGETTDSTNAAVTTTTASGTLTPTTSVQATVVSSGSSVAVLLGICLFLVLLM